MKKDLSLSIASTILLIVVIAIMYGNVRQNNTRLEKLIENSREVVDQDALYRALEKRIMDSVTVRLTGLKSRLQKDSIELLKLRKQNERLENNYRRIDVSDRPNF